ncbi:kinase-like domain-containing protein [Fusarium avenaceum]|nr:kinase-like domain-containing protein [Fusarium avenaceum]
MAPIQPNADIERQQFYDLAAPPKRLGRGRHAIVFECHGPRERIYAMKLYKQDSRDRINREIEVLRHLRSGPNTVQLIDIVQGDEGANIGVILEHVDNTDFRTLYPQFSDTDIRYYTRELLQALEFAHGEGIMHRDIRPHNVVIDHQNRKLRLIGWSSAEFYQPGEEFELCVGIFKPPELLLCYERYDYSMDMWSFGTMLAAMIFRKEPFFHGSSCIDQLLAAARVLGTESLYRFVEDYGIQMEQEDVETLGHHPRQPWRDLITPDNQHLATNEVIDLVDRLLQFDPRVSGRDSQVFPSTNVHALASSDCV